MPPKAAPREAQLPNYKSLTEESRLLNSTAPLRRNGAAVASLRSAARTQSGQTSLGPTFMIIWGWKAKQKEIASGSFYCPNCRQNMSYSHLRVSRYFTLYFMPLFPTATLGEAVRCQKCSGDFKLSVLGLTVEQIEKAIQPWACARCGNRNARSEARCLACGAAPGANPPPLPSDSKPAVTQPREADLPLVA
jgi:hypothetical protein